MSRDPDRIDEIIDWLRREWHQNCDQRLGQLIINLGPKEYRPSPLFNLEDTYWINKSKGIEK